MSSRERDAVHALVAGLSTQIESARDLMWRETLARRIGAAGRYVQWGVSTGALTALLMNDRLDRLVAAETSELLEQLLLLREGRLPCGHRVSELVAGYQVVTHCGACIRDRARL